MIPIPLDGRRANGSKNSTIPGSLPPVLSLIDVYPEGSNNKVCYMKRDLSLPLLLCMEIFSALNRCPRKPEATDALPDNHQDKVLKLNYCWNADD
jgi:hypothetical protein